MKTQRDDVAEEYCWAITQAVMLRQIIRLRCVVIWILAGLSSTYIHEVIHKSPYMGKWSLYLQN